MIEENTLDITTAAKMIGVTVKTMQRWDREGKLVPVSRTPSNRRLYSESQILSIMGMHHNVKPFRNIAYCRVSSAGQKPEMKNQRAALETFTIARGLESVEIIEEIGGGLNFKRKQFLSIMDAINRHEVKTLILAHKDRLVRFGYDWFEHYAKTHGCEIIVINQESLSPEEEMVQDLMTIVHCFSSRLYGLRHYKTKLNEILKTDK